MKRMLAFLFVVCLVAACGKNDGLYPAGGIDPNTGLPIGGGPYYGPYGPNPAPAPNGYYPPAGMYPQGGYPGGYPPNGFNPGAGMQPGAPNFVPRMPPGMPPQYTPFLPIDNYFRRSGPGQQYWNNYWNGWQNYAGQRGYNPYDFRAFWNDYCANQWGRGGYSNFYNYYNSNFYFWVNSGTQFGGFTDPYYFWQSYIGYSYAPLDGYGYCDQCGY